MNDEKKPLLTVPDEKNDIPVIEAVGEQPAEYENKPWQWKLLALVCSCLLSVGSHFAAHMLSSLKSTLIEELGITNAQYGILQSSVSLVNTVMPFFGGIFIDIFGTGIGSLVASSLIFGGDILVALSTEISSFPVMVVGRVIYGVGAGCIVTVQEAILAHWFKGKGLALTLGLQIGLARLSSALATATVIPIRDATDFYGDAFWVSASICGFSWLVNIVYLVVLKYAGNSQETKELEKRLRKKSNFNWKFLFALPIALWAITFMSFIFGTCWGPYLHISPDLISKRFGADERSASLQSSISLLIPVLVSPPLGLLIDMFGKRSWITLSAAITMTLGFFLLGFTMVTPYFGLVLFSISYTIGPIALISALPLVLDVSLIGTALGIYKCASNIGSTLVDPLIGYIQDLYGDYHEAMIVLTACAIVSIIGSFWMIFLNYTSLKGLFEATSARRKVIFTNYTVAELAPTPSKIVNIFFNSVTFTLLAASWGVFIALVIVGSE